MRCRNGDGGSAHEGPPQVTTCQGNEADDAALLRWTDTVVASTRATAAEASPATSSAAWSVAPPLIEPGIMTVDIAVDRAGSTGAIEAAAVNWAGVRSNTPRWTVEPSRSSTTWTTTSMVSVVTSRTISIVVGSIRRTRTIRSPMSGPVDGDTAEASTIVVAGSTGDDSATVVDPAAGPQCRRHVLHVGVPRSGERHDLPGVLLEQRVRPTGIGADAECVATHQFVDLEVVQLEAGGRGDRHGGSGDERRCGIDRVDRHVDLMRTVAVEHASLDRDPAGVLHDGPLDRDGRWGPGVGLAGELDRVRTGEIAHHHGVTGLVRAAANREDQEGLRRVDGGDRHGLDAVGGVHHLARLDRGEAGIEAGTGREQVAPGAGNAEVERPGDAASAEHHADDRGQRGAAQPERTGESRSPDRPATVRRARSVGVRSARGRRRPARSRRVRAQAIRSARSTRPAPGTIQRPTSSDSPSG